LTGLSRLTSGQAMLNGHDDGFLTKRSSLQRHLPSPIPKKTNNINISNYLLVFGIVFAALYSSRAA
jgi:hypothetical protein